VARDHRPLATWSAQDPAPLHVRPGDQLQFVGLFPFESPVVVATSSTGESVVFDYDLTFQTPLLAVIVPALPPGAWTIAVTGEADAVPPPGGVVLHVEP